MAGLGRQSNFLLSLYQSTQTRVLLAGGCSSFLELARILLVVFLENQTIPSPSSHLWWRDREMFHTMNDSAKCFYKTQLAQ